jgi:hypothetical protein
LLRIHGISLRRLNAEEASIKLRDIASFVVLEPVRFGRVRRAMMRTDWMVEGIDIEPGV